MADYWPWLVAAGAGAPPGRDPPPRRVFAAAWGVGSSGRAQALRALLPIAVGHAAAIAMIAAAVIAPASFGVPISRVILQLLAGGLLVVGIATHCLRHRHAKRATAGNV